MGINAQLLQIDPARIWSFLERIAERPWVVAIECLLIGSVVYTILRFLHGTRGARLVRALLTILAVSFAVMWLIAERYEFDRINVLYPYFILGVFLVFLVAFQTELRRMLLRLGQGGWMQRWFRTATTVIDPIVVAVERLGKKKIGALIALERSAEAGPVIETGVMLDAVVTAELLETIFWPGSVLHDLGVIIRQDRIIAAGCQFPLTESGEVDRSLGSRHRAAIGLSQEVDAVVLVVSEETGTVSVAIGGRLRRAVTPEALHALLTKELMVTVQQKGRRASDNSKVSPSPKYDEKVTSDGTGQAA